MLSLGNIELEVFMRYLIGVDYRELDVSFKFRWVIWLNVSLEIINKRMV